MIKSIFLALLLGVCFSVNGCSIYVGLSVHPEGADAPEHYAPNPIGMVGAEIDCPLDTKCFIEHRSSIPYYEQGLGLNEIGIKKMLDFR